MGNNDKGLVYHELGHAYQYEKGQISLFVNNSQYGSLYDISDETQSYSRERSLDLEYHSNPKMKMNDNDVTMLGKKQTPPAYQNLPSSPIDINSKQGKALRNKTIEAGMNGADVQEVYKNWQKDYQKGVKKGR